MLLKQARMVNWKTWAAKHECEELKEGVWLKPVQCCEGRPTSRGQEGGWVQKRMYEIGWSDGKKCRRCGEDEGVEKAST